MKNLIRLILACAILFSGHTYAQSNDTEVHFKDGDRALIKFLNIEFRKASKKYTWPTCITSVVFAKFSIDSIGNVKNLTFSDLKGTPQVLKTMMTSAILATNGLWIPRQVNGRSTMSKPYLLPLIYDLESGCNNQQFQRDGIYKKDYKPIPNNTTIALHYILDFENNIGAGNGQLDCIILQPLEISSVN